MNLQTKIPLKQQPYNQIDYKSNTLLLGSCFTEHIGDKLDYFKFKTTVNPFGILFHPIAIENFITKVINKTLYTEEELHFNNEQWCCLDAHSTFNSPSKEKILQRLNSAITSTHKNIARASHIIITLGTSWVYKHKVSNNIVANCHKIPQKEFSKELLSVDEICKSLSTITASISQINPDVAFMFTVSPVRHLKDGFIENTLSKAHLIAAIHKVLNQRPTSEIKNQKSFYFPSYEIMMDELRDYRFYNADMIHPNTIAIDYIWEKFSAVWLSESALEFMDKIDSIERRKAHKPFNPQSKAHQEFLNKLQLDIEKLKTHLPNISFNTTQN